MSALFAYAKNAKGELGLSVVLSVVSILAEGTQAQLLADCPLYRDMWQAHIGAKAWAVSSAGKEE